LKNKFSGIVSLMLLVCILAGNMVFASLSGKPSLAVPTMVQTKSEPEVETEPVRLPVLMYHHMLKEPKRWGDYVISPQQFEKDLCTIKAQGYTAVSCQQIIDFYEQGTPLPEKPILITFDDGYESLYEYAYSLLQKYKMKAEVNIIGKYTDLYSGDVIKDVSYSHANWDQLHEMLDSGLLEIGNHTYELHSNKQGERKGVKQLNGESDEDYRKLLETDIGSLNQEMAKELSIVPTVFAYPFGAYSEGTDAILKELGFKIVLTCEEKVNVLDRSGYQEGDLIRLMRFNRASKYSSEEIFAKFE